MLIKPKKKKLTDGFHRIINVQTVVWVQYEKFLALVAGKLLSIPDIPDIRIATEEVLPIGSYFEQHILKIIQELKKHGHESTRK